MMDNEGAMNNPDRSPAELEAISRFAVEHYWNSKITQREEGRHLLLRKREVELRISYRFDEWIGRWEYSSAEASRVSGGQSGPRYAIAPDCILHVVRHPQDIDKALP